MPLKVTVLPTLLVTVTTGIHRLKSEQQAEPACHASMRNIVLGRPPVLPADLLSCFPLHLRSSFSEIQELTAKGRLHAIGDGIVLLVRLISHPPSESQRPVGCTDFC